MRTQKYIFGKSLLIMVVASLLILAGCDDSSTDPETTPDNEETRAVVKGRVSDDGGFGDGLEKPAGGVEGAAVILARAQTNGSLETVSVAEVETDVNGEFELETNADDERNLIVVATKGNSEWKAVVTSEVTTGATVYAPPVNSETTVEAELYIEARANNQTNTVTSNNISFYVDEEVAAEINGDASAMSSVRSSIYTEAEAYNSALSASYFGNSQTDVNNAADAEVAAQVEFESDLYFGTDTETSYDNAWNSYYEVLLQGYSETEISMAEYAMAKETSVKAMTMMSTGLDSDVRFELMKRASYIKAKLLTEATVEMYAQAGAEEGDRFNARQAGNDLQIAVSIASSTGEINSAYAEFRGAIKADMKNTFEANAAQLAVVEAAVEGAIRSTLEASLSAAASTQAVINAYTTFYAAIDANADSNILIEDDAKVSAFACIYTLINMHN